MISDQYWTRTSPRPMTGEIYGSYRIEELIAVTKFSLLYSSTSLINGSKKAVKFIKCIKGKEERIKNEVEIMNKFDHPNLLKLEYSVRKNPYMIVVTDYAEYQDLYRFINRYYPSGMPSDVALYVMKQMIEAVSYLHSQGIWHRDIKPQNFLVFNKDKKRPHIVLADYGLAKEYQPYETDNAIVGTKEYMAPELINNFRYTSAIDIWALGITFFFILTNQDAFDEASSDSFSHENEQIERSIRNGNLRYKLLEEEKVSQELIFLIKNMCEVFPEKRITASDLSKHPLFISTKISDVKNASSLSEIEIREGCDDAIPCI